MERQGCHHARFNKDVPVQSHIITVLMMHQKLLLLMKVFRPALQRQSMINLLQDHLPVANAKDLLMIILRRMYVSG